MLRFCLLSCLLLATTSRADEPAYVDPAITPAQKSHWAYQPPVRHALPTVQNTAWVRTPIDAFILAKLESKGLKPSLEADRLTLLRRVTIDLTGLPPTPQEIAAFLLDRSPTAYETVVERLLASPHYGERWAQHWLDVVRFAETDGYEADRERINAWRYRDYVVRAFASDKPFDQFLREQIAGDLLAAGKPDREAAELLIATGMHRCGPMHFVGGNIDQAMVRNEILIEMVNGLSAAVMGMTMGCARCHDHKFDPISTGDYYRLQAFFAPTQLKDRDLSTAADKVLNAKEAEPLVAKIEPLRARVAAIDAPHRAKLTERKKNALEPMYREALAVPAEKRTAEQKKLAAHANILLEVTWDEVLASLSSREAALRKQLRDEIFALEAHLPPPPAAAWAVGDDEKVPPTHILKRGELKAPMNLVEPAFPRVTTSEVLTSSGRLNRLDLANWLTRPEHPLTGRVWVNRVWLYHFGRGLVSTPSDFGTRGEAPTHPELLDWLATELPRRGWSTKELHRLMVLSATYRQSSGSGADSENKWLSRMNRRRLEGESLRDAMLAASGQLNREIGGPKVRVPLEKEVYDLIFTEGEPDGLWKPTPDPRQHGRRSLYLFLKRNVRLPLLEAFDQPDTLNSCGIRAVSTFAPQALIMMNGPMTQELARAFAKRLRREAGDEPSAQAALAYRLALGRAPRAEEAQAAESFLKDRDALSEFCLVLFNLNEFIYVD